MTTTFVQYLLRISLVGLVALPLIIPFIENSVERQPPKTLMVWVDSSLPWNDAAQLQAERKLRDKLSLDNSIRINFRKFGARNQTPTQDFEELTGQLTASTGEQVILSNGSLWGPAARNFQRRMLELAKSPSRKIQVITPQDLQLRTGQPALEKFLALSELSAPQLNFLGEPSQLSLDIIGKLKPQESQTVEVVIRSGESLLTSKTVTVTADASGIVNSIENIPVHFTRAQQQLLTAQLSTELSPVPLNMASTSVSVVHSKSTVLHVGVGPDWSLRNIRTKLKFWPNLDLLSYYILREISDDLSIPSNQLSLIEFPAEKLFGEQLPNFHGVLAQNFVFDSYLNQQDTQNLFDYVNLNGGRLVIQAGPLSFLGRDSKIKELLPCENIPEFDFEKPHAWRVGKNRFLSEAQFESAVGQIVTRQTAIGCKPKDGALVLAETNDNPPSPMILAYPVGKGLVVAFLAGDWHTFAGQSEAATPTQRAQRVYAVDASERLFQWMVEFLQRRQDSGLRPPQFAGPRVYRNDPLHLVRSRGGMPEDGLLRGAGIGFNGLLGRPRWMSQLSLESVVWARWASEQVTPTAVSEDVQSNLRELTRAPNFETVGLQWQPPAGESVKSAQADGQRLLVWPVFDGTMRQRENLRNPVLFPEELTKISADFSKSLARTEEIREQRVVPLLSAYPWLLALALALLAAEQLISRLFSANPASRASGRQ